MSSISSVTDGSSLGDFTDDDEFLEAKVEVRYAGSGATLLRCNYEPATATVYWLLGQLISRQLIPAGARVMSLATIPRCSYRVPRILADISKMLQEIWDEETVFDEYDDTLFLQIVFSS